MRCIVSLRQNDELLEALGNDYAKLQMVESLGYNQVKLIPDNIIIGGSEGSSLINQFMAIEMTEKVTGKSWNASNNKQK
ncbi:MAG: hypothetical protein LBO69_04685 [Ignavibacteria bacterium]|nr:hypothetical protein [Ignavibacteria bacterium]